MAIRETICPACGGSGRDGNCTRCRGSGLVRITVAEPSGLPLSKKAKARVVAAGREAESRVRQQQAQQVAAEKERQAARVRAQDALPQRESRTAGWIEPQPIRPDAWMSGLGGRTGGTGEPDYRVAECPLCRGTGAHGRCNSCGGTGVHREVHAITQAKGARIGQSRPEATAALIAQTTTKPRKGKNSKRVRSEPAHRTVRTAGQKRFALTVEAAVGQIAASKVALHPSLLSSPFILDSLAADTIALLRQVGPEFKLLQWTTPSALRLVFSERVEILERVPGNRFNVVETERTGPGVDGYGRRGQESAKTAPVPDRNLKSSNPERRFKSANSSQRQRGPASEDQPVGSNGTAKQDSVSTERDLDGSKGWHALRESVSGQFGSYPSHDNHGDESEP
jgi:hypothetical protein